MKLEVNGIKVTNIKQLYTGETTLDGSLPTSRSHFVASRFVSPSRSILDFLSGVTKEVKDYVSTVPSLGKTRVTKAIASTSDDTHHVRVQFQGKLPEQNSVRRTFSGVPVKYEHIPKSEWPF